MRNALLFFFLLFSFSAYSQFQRFAERGVLDLRDADLENYRVSLEGEWEFYWKQLLSPAEIHTLNRPDYFPFPGLWNNAVTSQGIATTHMGYATYRLRVLLPPDPPPLLLSITHFYNNFRLFADGEEIASSGRVGTSPETSAGHWLPQTARPLPQSDTLELVLHVSNFEHAKGGARETIYLGERALVTHRYFLDLSYDLLSSGCIIMAGLFFLGLYFFGQREKYILAYALFCLVFSYRFFGADNYVMHVLYPELPWSLTLHLEYLALFLAPSLFAIFSYTLFPKDGNWKVLGAFVALSLLLSLLTILTPPAIFTNVVEPYLLLLIAVIAYVSYIYFAAARHNREGANYVLASTLVVLVLFTYKIYVYLFLEEENHLLTFTGFVFFFFLQSLHMFFRVTRSLHQARDAAENASRAKSEFLSMMSHEIRTPMNAVIGLTNYMIEDKPKKGHVEVLNTLKFSAENLLVILNDILDFNKIEAKKIEFERLPVNLPELMLKLKKVFENTAREKGLYLDLAVDPNVSGSILCDATRTSQIMSNLIGNAIKFTRQGGVRVTVTQLDRLAGFVTLRFSVKDTGIGISKADQEKIFESFTQASTSVTREYGGTGLGLTITRRLLNLQGVELQLSSELGEGSEFWFVQQFEIAEDETAAETAKLEAPELVEGPARRVLLVEDNKINVMVAQKFLTRWGFAVDVAYNGQEALNLAEKQSYDLVLMDLQMPVMDGYEASRQLRKSGFKGPIIALTASALSEDTSKVAKNGMDDHILKPFNPEEFRTKLNIHLASGDKK